MQICRWKGGKMWFASNLHIYVFAYPYIIFPTFSKPHTQIKNQNHESAFPAV
jgi:hypothetical protein